MLHCSILNVVMSWHFSCSCPRLGKKIDVLEENLELIRRQLGLEHVEVLSAFDGAARAKAGRHGPVLDKNPPSPGEPVAIFMSKEEFGAQN